MMTVALLVSKSRESQNKAKQLKRAASALGIAAEIFTDKPTVGFDLEIPCSDSRVNDTLWGRRVGWMGSKSLSAQTLSKLGINSLPTFVVNSQQDVLRCEIEGPIFVKSDRSSGVVSPHSFGYQRFDSVRVFYDHTRSAFPGALDDLRYREGFGPYVIQPFLENAGMVTASFVNRTPIAPAFVKTDSTCFYDWMHFSPSREIGQSKMLQPLAEYAASPFLYVQCLEHAGALYPIDINVRLSTYLDTLMTAKNPAFYEWCWRTLCGETEYFDVGEHLIGRIKTDFSKPGKAYGDGAMATLLNFGNLVPAAGKFDAAYSYPTYIISGGDCMIQRERFVQSVVVEQ